MQRNEKFAEDCSLAVLLQPFEMTPKQLQLLEAARKNDVTELETLLSKHVNVNARNNLDRTALHWAAANGNDDAIDVLLRSGANVNATDKYGMTPLLLASWFGHVMALEKLAKNKKIVLNCFNKQGMNAIHCAAANDHLNILEFLHQSEFTGKIDINKQELRGKTSLHLAAEKGFEETVDYLLTAIGSDPLPTDLTGRTALHLAAAGGHYDVTYSLLQIPGLDIINQTDNHGFTALHLASAAGHSDVVHLLLLSNADVNAQAKKRTMSALTLASAGGHLETVSQLLTNPICDRDHQNEDGDTSVHLASTNNSIHIVRLLITKGCDLNVANKLGQTPLHIGAEMGHSAIVQLLLASRADPSRRDGAGKTALALASRANHVSIADMIIKKERLQKQLPNNTIASSEYDPGRVSGSVSRTPPAADQRSIANDNVIGDEALIYGATRYREDATEEQDRVKGEDRFEDVNLEDSKSRSSTGTRNKQSTNNREIHLQGIGDEDQRLRSATVRRVASADGIDEVDAVSGQPSGRHDNLGDRDDSGSVQEDGINEASENSKRSGVTDVNPRSADGDGASDCSRSSSPTHSQTPTPHLNRRDSGSSTGCYLNTGFSLDEIIELRTGSRHGSADARLPAQPEQPGSIDDEISVLDSDVFLATSSTAGDADSTVGSTDHAGMSSAVVRTDPAMSSDLDSSSAPVATTDSVRIVRQTHESQSRNLSRVGSDRSHASGISFQALERMESDSSVFEDGHASFQLGQVAVRRQSSVDRMSAMKEVLWKLAMNQLKQGEWKRMARHWQFTDEQTRAIEHQYTGSKSYRDHGYRMLVIWLECYLEGNPPPAGNPLRDLFDALVAISRRKLAEQIRSKCNRPSETRKSCKIS